MREMTDDRRCVGRRQKRGWAEARRTRGEGNYGEVDGVDQRPATLLTAAVREARQLAVAPARICGVCGAPTATTIGQTRRYAANTNHIAQHPAAKFSHSPSTRQRATTMKHGLAAIVAS